MRFSIRRRAALFALLAVAATAVMAQDKKQLREESKSLLAQLTTAGEPKDRCSLNAFIADGAIVSRVLTPSPLMPGDLLLSLNGHDVSKRASDEVIKLLRAIEPTANVALTVIRSGEQTSLNVACTNARSTTEILVNALTFASKGKFDECYASLPANDELGSYGAVFRVQCAALSRKSEGFNVAKLTADALAMLIEDARWVPAGRLEVVRRVRAAEGLITQRVGPSRYSELISAIRSLPQGEYLLERSTPDWAAFRRTAEESVQRRLIDPESARIEWPYGFLLGAWRPFMSKPIEGYWTCGFVNAKNRMGGYTGSTPFVVVLDQDGWTKYVELGTAKDFDFLTAQCENSVKLLPSPPPELRETNLPPAQPSLSIADELKKLAELRATGALSEAEFQAAKQQLLGTSSK